MNPEIEVGRKSALFRLHATSRILCWPYLEFLGYFGGVGDVVGGEDHHAVCDEADDGTREGYEEEHPVRHGVSTTGRGVC